jgi:hypothetical protein
MIQTVRKTMEKTSTHIHVQEIILQGIKSAARQESEQVDDEQLSFQPSGIIKDALREQNAIGWTNFYKGRMSKKWERVQHQHYQSTKPKKTDTHRWATSIIAAMWNGFLLMWEDRNDDQHGRDNIETAGKERDKLLQKVTQLYSQKERIDPEDRRIYHTPEEKCKEETNKKIKEWINLAEPLTKNIKKTTRKRQVDPRQAVDKKILHSAAQRGSTEKYPYVHKEAPPAKIKMRSNPQSVTIPSCPIMAATASLETLESRARTNH